jgi:hypothetical protein
VSGVQSGTELERLQALRTRVGHEIRSLELAIVRGTSNERGRLDRLRLVRDQVDDRLGQPRFVPFVKPKRADPARDRIRAAGLPPAVVRAWAIEQGLTTARRGRIPVEIVDAYVAAHQGADQ